MPPSPRSLLWPTMLMPRKLYFSVMGEAKGRGQERERAQMSARRRQRIKPRTEMIFNYPCWVWRWWCWGSSLSLWCCWRTKTGRERRDVLESMKSINRFGVLSGFRVPELALTRSILDTLCLRRRRLCLRISCEEELCSVELLSLRQWRETVDSGDFADFV